MEPRGFPVRNRLRLLENRNMLIGLTQLPDKLVFVKVCCHCHEKCCHCEPVRLSGVAIPRLEGKCIDICPTEQKISHFW